MKWVKTTAMLLLVPVLGMLGCGRSEDYSTPKAAARTFYSALMGGDTEGARSAVCDSGQAAMIENVRDLIAAILAAQDAAVSKFGDSGKQVSGGLPSLEDVEAAEERINGETAELVGRNTGLRSLRVRKVQGLWKVDVFATLGMPPDRADRILKSAVSQLQELPQQIRSGKFSNAGEADAAIQRSFASAAVGELLRGLQ